MREGRRVQQVPRSAGGKITKGKAFLRRKGWSPAPDQLVLVVDSAIQVQV